MCREKGLLDVSFPARAFKSCTFPVRVALSIVFTSGGKEESVVVDDDVLLLLFWFRKR